jgi:lipopolysaccharide/colanic/teichoic acid biosynthesis glycosyltransferase
VTFHGLDMGRVLLIAVVAAAAVAPPERVARRVGRVADVVLSAATLVLLSPVLAVVSLAVRRELGARVPAPHEREGRSGLLRVRSASEAGGPVGRFVQRYSLDEIPRLYDVLVGDVSLVGRRVQDPTDAATGRSTGDG